MSDVNTRKLDAFIRALAKGTKSKIRVGVAGTRNATIGSYHEFGTSTIPQRSFLRMPLTEAFPKVLANSGAFDKDTLKQVVDQASMKPWLQKIAILAEGTIQDAFDTGGFGKWPPHSPNTHSITGQLLVETGQLRNAVFVEIKGE